jgi:TRAP-type C4-dicarboxylate transport system permease small subunit
MKFERLVRAAGNLAAIGTILIMFQVVIDSGSRTLLGSSLLSGTFEHVQYWWMPLIAFGGLALAEQQNEHITAPVVYDRLSPAAQRIWLLFGNAVTATLLVLLTYIGWLSAVDARQLGESRGATNVPVWPLRFWIVLGAALYAVRVVIGTVEEFRRIGLEARDDNAMSNMAGGPAL